MRLNTRPAQWVGVVLIIGWSAFVGLGVPRIADAIPNEVAVEAGQSVTAGGVSLTPLEGWSPPADLPGIMSLNKQGAQIIASEPRPATGDATAELAAAMAWMSDDTTTGWQISEPVPFTTDGGLQGMEAVALSPQGFVANFVVIDAGQSYPVTVTGNDTDWKSLQDEIFAIVKTLKPSGAAQ